MALAFNIETDDRAKSQRTSTLKTSVASVAQLPQVPPAQRVAAAPTAVTELPKKPKLSAGLKLLVGLQQGSTVLTGGLVAGALLVYSWTVYVDKMVGRTYQSLETLRTEAQQMTAANEMLKHSLVEQAATALQFQVPQPNRAIFLSPEPNRPASDDLSPEPNPAASAQAEMPHPLGY
ncbi:MAG: hypothetical protein F6J97_02700 [Leptolyngbya sp. SIO4C1]|nr:hypothetical protein [Leptolyngbya sp. SIO4C1]